MIFHFTSTVFPLFNLFVFIAVQVNVNEWEAYARVAVNLKSHKK